MKLSLKEVALAFYPPLDKGPIYAESLMGYETIVEPLNTFSNLAFLALCLYWLFKVTRNWEQSRNNYGFILFCLPVLFIGFLGGSLFHATRAHEYYRYLDFGSIYLLVFFVLIYFWRNILDSWAAAWAISLTLAGIGYFASSYPLFMDPITWSYLLAAINVSVAAFLCAKKYQWRFSSYLVRAVAFLGIALSFRLLDQEVAYFFAHGSHFLWHIFGALSCHLLIAYIFCLEKHCKA